MAQLTLKELNDLKFKKEQLEQRKNISHVNCYGDNAYRNDLSPSEYMEIAREIEDINKKISNAVIVPSINIDSKFSVEVDGEPLNMLMAVNYIEIEGLVCCTCDSVVGKALLDKKVDDVVTVTTPECGEKTYKIISIEQ